MIRPFTCICVLLAAASGLYLYQEKHRAQLLEIEIGQVVKQIDAAHARTALLRAEWALLNEPDRLADLAGRHLPNLRPMAPAQFVQMADLDAHLPAPLPAGTPAATAPVEEAPAPVTDTPVTDTPVTGAPAAANPTAAPTAPAPSGPVAAAPRPEAPARPAMVASRPRPPERHPVQEARSFEPPRVREPAPVMAPVVSAYAPPGSSLLPARRPPVLQRTEAIAPEPQGQVPMVTSALGEARSTYLAPPVPIVPVSNVPSTR
jgi:hypothetical protein